MKKDEGSTYDPAARIFHWLSAALVFGLLVLGLYMTPLAVSPFKIELYSLHKSFGILLLMLMAGRLFWRLASPPPGPLQSHAFWERALAKLAHILLYIGLFAMPFSGWLMSSAGGFPAGFFGLFELPALTGKSERLFDLAKAVHWYTALTITILVIMHVAGALKHHFIDRDRTLKRMSAESLGLKGAAVLALAAGAFLAVVIGLEVRLVFGHAQETERPARVEAEDTLADGAEKTAARPEKVSVWDISHSRSRLEFTATQYGQPFSGEFKHFDGKIYFDPEALQESYARIEIDIKSLKTGSEDRDAQALSQEWFYTDQYPHAVFQSRRFEKTGTANAYIAEGDLTLRGITKAITFPFTLKIDGQTAHMQAALSLNRLDFGIGQGQWQSAKAIGDEIRIKINLQARRK